MRPRALLLVTLPIAAFVACGGSDDESAFTNGSAGASGSGTAGSGTAGSGTAGSGTAGSGTAGTGTSGSATAGSGTSGSGTAGSGTAGSGTAGSGTAGSGTAGSGTAGSGTSGSGTAGSGTAGSATAGAGGGPCLPKVEKAVRAPLDLVFLVDKSASQTDMGKWKSLVDALSSFAKLPSSSGLGVSLTYFPTAPSTPPNVPPTCAKDADCGDYGPCIVFPPSNICAGMLAAGDSCTADDYAKPVLTVMTLPAAEPAFSSSLATTMPDGGTPTTAALSGVLAYASTWAAAHKDHSVRVVLATDGEPTGCTQNTLDTASAVAKTAYQSKGIRTVVIGLGDMLTALDQIAAAGGSKKAVLVNAGASASGEIVKAIDGAGAQRACVFAVPKAGASVVLSAAGTKKVLTPAVDPGPCTGEGYRLDDPASPSRLELCDATCDEVIAKQAEITYELPCG